MLNLTYSQQEKKNANPADDLLVQISKVGLIDAKAECQKEGGNKGKSVVKGSVSQVEENKVKQGDSDDGRGDSLKGNYKGAWRKIQPKKRK